MKDFQKTLKELRELSTISEETKALLEKMTGKELVDYESIDALVGALMTHYNGELKKKAQISHSHDDRYYTEGEIDTKFKNLSLVPVPVGGVLMMYNTSNPAEIYPNTIWELIQSSKYIMSSDTPLQIGGNNSLVIEKKNLPNIKLKVDTFSLTTQPHTHNFKRPQGDQYYQNGSSYGAWWGPSQNATQTTLAGGGQNTGTANPLTETLGNGTALNIQPEYITLKFWKRLT